MFLHFFFFKKKKAQRPDWQQNNKKKTTGKDALTLRSSPVYPGISMDLTMITSQGLQRMEKHT